MLLKPFRRRALIRGLGLGIPGLYLPSLHTQAHAAALPPKRFVVIYSGHGPVYQNWRIRKPNLADVEQDWQIDLNTLAQAEWGKTLAPLYAHRSRINVIDGLANVSGMSDRLTNNHNVGISHMLTGGPMIIPAGLNNEGAASSSSIDQLAADQLAVRGRLRSVFLSTGGPVPFYRGDTELGGETDAIRAFERLFPANIKSPDARTNTLRERHGLVLSKVRQEYERVKSQLGGEDQKKIAAHFELVDAMAASVEYRQKLVCPLGKAPPAADGKTDSSVRAFNDLGTGALACDLTRVLALQWGQISAPEMGMLGFNVGDVHQDLAHEARDGNAFAQNGMTAYYRLHAQQFSDLLDKLVSVPEGDGSMLDNTLVLWLNELASGTHTFNRLMVVMAGNLGGYFKTGRYLKYAETKEFQFSQYSASGGTGPVGPGHSHALVSCLHALGSTTNAVGLAQARADGGKTADLSGPLARLKA